ncbi:hypothetical protein Leryth_008707 [Lithospermum erythrorhizon]|nr:hypothetical protein Leryth_008707 [Lithospermum erythrorhizon]
MMQFHCLKGCFKRKRAGALVMVQKGSMRSKATNGLRLSIGKSWKLARFNRVSVVKLLECTVLPILMSAGPKCHWLIPLLLVPTLMRTHSRGSLTSGLQLLSCRAPNWHYYQWMLSNKEFYRLRLAICSFAIVRSTSIETPF